MRSLNPSSPQMLAVLKWLELKIDVNMLTLAESSVCKGIFGVRLGRALERGARWCTSFFHAGHFARGANTLSLWAYTQAYTHASSHPSMPDDITLTIKSHSYTASTVCSQSCFFLLQTQRSSALGPWTLLLPLQVTYYLFSIFFFGFSVSVAIVYSLFQLHKINYLLANLWAIYTNYIKKLNNKWD